MEATIRERIGKRALKKITWRILPWMAILYFMAVLDRSNLSNVQLFILKREIPTNQSCEANCTTVTTGIISKEEYGYAVGIFFISYMLFEIPSNLALKKTGAPTWLSRIMISWGIVTICTMFIKNAIGLIICRFILGATEAGFWPGGIYYLSTWYNKKERSTRIGLFYVTSPFSGVIAGVLSYVILQMDGIQGLYGWQWLFLIEGIPSVILGILTFFVLPTDPQTCTFLTDAEKEWTISAVAEGQQVEADAKSISKEQILGVFKNWRIWMFCILSFGHNCTHSITTFFTPSIINEFGLSPLMSNLLSAGPFGFGVICILLVSKHSDYTGERPGHLLIPFMVQIAGWAVVGVSFYISGNLAFQYAMLTFTVGIHYAFVPIFWAWLVEELKGGTTVAVSTATVTSFGSLGSIITPFLTTFILNETGTYLWVMVVLASIGGFCFIVGVALAILLRVFPENYEIIEDEELPKKIM